MKVRMVILLVCIGLLLLLCGCTSTTTGSSANRTPAVTTTSPGLPNPAAVFCTGKGYKYEIRQNTDGSEYGVCIFPGGKECEEWTFYRGTCNETTGKSP
ncbi:MAG TPA: DUF333 domain-containing protein [Methanomicrobiales archaeon]|nr:DUF333 domain-containing protein [Methanomicrobiales archaeon]